MACCHPESTNSNITRSEQAVGERATRRSDNYAVKNPKNFRATAESRSQVRSARKAFQKLGEIAQHSGYSRCLEGEGFRVERPSKSGNEAFRLIGEKPVSFSGRLEDVLIEDFRKSL